MNMAIYIVLQPRGKMDEDTSEPVVIPHRPRPEISALTSDDDDDVTNGPRWLYVELHLRFQKRLNSR